MQEPKKWPPEPKIELTDELDHADPPNIFVTPQAGMHLRPDFIHHPNPLKRSERATPIYDQVKRKLGWDPVARDDPPWIKRLHKKAK